MKNILILVGIIFLVYYPCLHAGFINLDDDGHILNNPALQYLSPDSLKQLLTQTPNNTYIPLTSLTFAFEKYFFGFNPFIFHGDNLLLFALVAVLVMGLANRMGLGLEAGFLAALIFAVHPMKVESVAWVTERKDVLYALFYLLALHRYCSYLKTRSWQAYVAVCLFGLLSMLAKPMAVSLPLILFLFDWYEGRPFSPMVILEKIPICLYMAGIAWITLALNLHHRLPPISQGILIWIWSLSFYVWHFLFPFFVCPYYPWPQPISITQWPYWTSLLTVLSIVYLLIRFSGNRLFVFAILYFIASIFFLLHFDKNGFGVVADRFMFLPSLGLCFFIASWVQGRLKSRMGKAMVLILLTLLGLRANIQCNVWHDSLSFWNEIILYNPDFYWAYVDRGAAFYQKGDLYAALADYNRAIALKPDAPKAYNNRAVLFDSNGQEELALADLTHAITLDPSAPWLYLNRSIIEKNQKEYHLALKDALEAKQLGAVVTDAYLRGLSR